MWDRDFLDKWDMGKRMESRLFCFGSGTTDEGSGSNDDSGGRKPGEGQVFGVDGVSKTGSTSRDAAIGYTDGSGGQGVNYNALQNATRSQTNAAVAAANAAAQAGGDAQAQSAAARATLNNVSPQDAADRAVAMQNTFGAGAGIAQALGMGPNAARVTAADEAAMNAMFAGNARANAAASGYNPAADMGLGFMPGYDPSTDMGFGYMPGGNPGQAAIQTIDNMLGKLEQMKAREAQRRALSGGQTTADVQALNAQAGEVYYDEKTGTYKAGALPDTQPTVSALPDVGLGFAYMPPQTADEVRAMSDAAGEVYYDEVTGRYMPGPLPGISPAPIPSASYFADLSVPRANVNNVSVSGPNLPPPTITDQSGVTFDTTTGEIISRPSNASYFADLGGNYRPASGNNASYFGDLGAGLERIDSPMVPVSPPPRYQTNAQRDFYEGLAGQGDAAMNAFRAELRNLDNRGFMGRQIAGGIGADGVPNYDLTFPEGSRIRGVTNTNFVDLPFLGTTPISTYTGMNNPNAQDSMADSGDESVVAPIDNPLTNQPRCPDGYVFDDDLQACRLDVSGGASQAQTGDGDIYYRRTALDDAPANVPSGFDFGAANRRFTQSYGYRPDYYRSPMSLTGFTRLS